MLIMSPLTWSAGIENPAAMKNMARPWPAKLFFSRVVRPVFSIREAATMVPKALVRPTARDARVSEVTPACQKGNRGEGRQRKGQMGN